ncbi:bifunctional DNA primase/polymerase [Solwaraspora sp. WMMD406]|uniref:bifunctional DNA primase/polymerase n=1 Tax=Solwaraspora sp. WMMD406 TaxID=3016095 RepID=UPI002416FCB5|nr:bifunctional DNA primase/polymerase [Solwaraspora sp. WMMD406]MDG4768508.1 bifunctional DNA primase/polymerase [Solwaraspora sp. WMMD406]
MTDTTSLLAAALQFAARGWHVFPLRPNDKRPAVTDWEHRATTDADRIRRCWTAGNWNVGIACGPSGLVVVDCDTPKPDTVLPDPWRRPGIRDGGDVLADLADQHDQPYPCDTYTVGTRSGGTHLYYRQPDTDTPLRNTAGRLGPMVDTRAAGGYVVAAGSMVDRRPYTLTIDTNPTRLPDWLTALLRPAPLPPQRPVAVDLGGGRRAAYVGAAIRRQVDHLTAAPEGGRNHALYVSAVALGQLAAGGAITSGDVYAVLEPAARSLPGRQRLTDREIARTIASGLRAGAKRPRSVAA